MAMYSKVEYWNKRYEATASETYEWYQSYTHIRPFLDPSNLAAAPDSDGVARHYMPREECRILILGCGNSRMGEELQRDGWTGKIVNVDFSPVVIQQMKAKYTEDYYTKNKINLKNKQHCQMEFICADITEKLPFEDESFDLIICKGSFDAVLCSSGAMANIRKLIKESVRLLKDGSGVFFLVTYGNPDSRVVYLEHENELDYYWEGVSVHTIPGQKQPNKNDYIYICRKCYFGSKKAASSENKQSVLISNNENIPTQKSYAENKKKKISSKEVKFNENKNKQIAK